MKQSLPPFRKQKIKVFDNFSKTGQFVYSIGESPILRRKSKPVPVRTINTLEFQEKLRYLKKCLRRYKKLTGLGKGIAAPQVGISERFFIVWISLPHVIPAEAGIRKKDSPFQGNDKILVVINPKIINASKKLLSYPEVCMSAYPLIARVVRPSWIEFEYLDEKGNKKIWNVKSDTKVGRMLNRVFEHEIDHLEGIINIDRVPSKDLEFSLSKRKAKFKKV